MTLSLRLWSHITSPDGPIIMNGQVGSLWRDVVTPLWFLSLLPTDRLSGMAMWVSLWHGLETLSMVPTLTAFPQTLH